MNHYNKMLQTSVKVAGTKLDTGKPPMALMSSVALEELSRVLDFGAQKYGANQWRNGIGYTRLLSACLRHVFSFLRGEDKDEESGLSHLAHAMCNLMFLLEYIKTGSGIDDRYKGKD